MDAIGPRMAASRVSRHLAFAERSSPSSSDHASSIGFGSGEHGGRKRALHPSVHGLADLRDLVCARVVEHDGPAGAQGGAEHLPFADVRDVTVGAAFHRHPGDRPAEGQGADPRDQLAAVARHLGDRALADGRSGVWPRHRRDGPRLVHEGEIGGVDALDPPEEGDPEALDPLRARLGRDERRRRRPPRSSRTSRPTLAGLTRWPVESYSADRSAMIVASRRASIAARSIARSPSSSFVGRCLGFATGSSDPCGSRTPRRRLTEASPTGKRAAARAVDAGCTHLVQLGRLTGGVVVGGDRHDGQAWVVTLQRGERRQAGGARPAPARHERHDHALGCCVRHGEVGEAPTAGFVEARQIERRRALAGDDACRRGRRERRCGGAGGAAAPAHARRRRGNARLREGGINGPPWAPATTAGAAGEVPRAPLRLAARRLPRGPRWPRREPMVARAVRPAPPGDRPDGRRQRRQAGRPAGDGRHATWRSTLRELGLFVLHGGTVGMVAPLLP
jgi:hypothetical protein